MDIEGRIQVLKRAVAYVKSTGEIDPQILPEMDRFIESYTSYESIDQFRKKKPEFLYILVEPKYVQSCLPVAKIGKTTRQVIDRLKEYPKGSILLGSGHVENCTLGEKLLISEFNKLYERKTDLGLEYFKGNISNMEITFHEMILKIKKIEKILNTKVDVNISKETDSELFTEI